MRFASSRRLLQDYTSSNVLLLPVAFTLVFLDFMVGTSCTNFSVVYNPIFKEQLMSYRQNDLKNRVEFFEINERYDTLQNITTTLKKIRKGDVVLLFTNNDAFYEKILRNQTLVLKYGVSIASRAEGNLGNSFCLVLNESLERTLVMLTLSLSKHNVILITDETVCARDFYAKWKANVNNHQNNNGFHVNPHHVIYHRTQNSFTNQSSLQAFKALGETLIISLVPRDYFPIYTRQLLDFGMLGSSSIWLIPSYSLRVAPLVWYPEKILSLEFRESELKIARNHYKRLDRCVSNVVRIYDTFLNLTFTNSILQERIYQSSSCIQGEKEGANSEGSDDVKSVNVNVRYLDRRSHRQDNWIKDEATIDKDGIQFIRKTIPMLHPIPDMEANNTINIVTINNPPYVVALKEQYDPLLGSCNLGLICHLPFRQNNTLVYEATCCNGFVIELLELILEYTKLPRIRIYIVEDRKYGAIGSNGEWVGIIGDIVKGKADMAIADLSMTKIRSSVVDFTTPFIEAKMGMVFRPELSTNLHFINFKIVVTMSSMLLLVLFIVILITIVLNFIFENGSLLERITKNEYVQKRYYPLYESLTYISGVTLQRDLGGKNPGRLEARVSAVTFAFAMVVIVTTYTAVLAASHIQRVETNPFKGTEDERMRNPTPTFKFGTSKGTSYVMFFRNAESKSLKRMYHFMEKYNVDSTKHGIDEVVKGNLQAFIGNAQLIYWQIARRNLCNLKVHKDIAKQGGYSIAMKKNFKWKELLDEAVLRYKGSEELNAIHSKWFWNACDKLSGVVKPEQQGMMHFGGLIFILCVTAAVCFPILLPEHLYQRCLQKSNYVTT